MVDGTPLQTQMAAPLESSNFIPPELVILRPRWRTVETIGPWFTEAPPPRDYLLRLPADRASGREERGLLPRGEVGLLSAGGGVGKTRLLCQLALSVATGRPVLAGLDGEGGFLPPPEGGRVLLLLGEEDLDEIRRRLWGAARLMRRTAALTDDDLDVAAKRIVPISLRGLDAGLMRSTDDDARDEVAATLTGELEQCLNETGPFALVLIDPMARFAGADAELDNYMATRFVEILERLTRTAGRPTVLIAHHTSQTARRVGLSDDTAARGVTALSDGVRWHATLVNLPTPAGAPKLAVFTVAKSNYAAPLDEPLMLARDDYGFLYAASKTERIAHDEASEKAKPNTKEKATRSAVVRKQIERILSASSDKMFTKTELAERTKASPNTVGPLLFDLEAEGLVRHVGKHEGWQWVRSP